MIVISINRYCAICRPKQVKTIAVDFYIFAQLPFLFIVPNNIHLETNVHLRSSRMGGGYRKHSRKCFQITLVKQLISYANRIF